MKSKHLTVVDNCFVFNHRENCLFRYYLFSGVIVFVYVCVDVFAVKATPFNLEFLALA